MTRKQHRSRRRRAACAMRGCVATARAACQSWPGSRACRWAMACELLKSQTPSVAPAARQRQLAGVERRGGRARYATTVSTCAPAAASWSASQSRPDGLRPRHRRRARSAPCPRAAPGRATCCHRVSESNCADCGGGESTRDRGDPGFEQGVAGAGAGGPGAGLRRPGVPSAGRWPKKCRTALPLTNITAAVAIQGRARPRATARSGGAGTIAISGKRQRVDAALLAAREPSAGPRSRAG